MSQKYFNQLMLFGDSVAEWFSPSKVNKRAKRRLGYRGYELPSESAPACGPALISPNSPVFIGAVGTEGAMDTRSNQVNRGPRERMTLRLPDGEKTVVRLVVNPRATRISVKIDPKSRAPIAVAPRERDLEKAAAFAAERVDWIAAGLKSLPPATPLEPGSLITLRGQACRLVHSRVKDTRFVPGEPQRLEVAAPEGAFASRVKLALRAEAEKDLDRAVARHAARLNVTPKKITIKDMASRYGSCAPDGKLAFTWRLILAPNKVLDYVAAHEVAHLREMNHSPRFWAHVKASYGDPSWAKKWLRENGQALMSVGLFPAG